VSLASIEALEKSVPDLRAQRKLDAKRGSGHPPGLCLLVRRAFDGGGQGAVVEVVQLEWCAHQRKSGVIMFSSKTIGEQRPMVLKLLHMSSGLSDEAALQMAQHEAALAVRKLSPFILQAHASGVVLIRGVGPDRQMFWYRMYALLMPLSLGSNVKRFLREVGGVCSWTAFGKAARVQAAPFVGPCMCTACGPCMLCNERCQDSMSRCLRFECYSMLHE
jgi:ferredoxin